MYIYIYTHIYISPYIYIYIYVYIYKFLSSACLILFVIKLPQHFTPLSDCTDTARPSQPFYCSIISNTTLLWKHLPSPWTPAVIPKYAPLSPLKTRSNPTIRLKLGNTRTKEMQNYSVKSIKWQGVQKSAMPLRLDYDQSTHKLCFS